MPNPGSDEPITKITLNLYSSDIVFLKKLIGDGWSTHVRDLVRRAVRAKKAEQESKNEDL